LELNGTPHFLVYADDVNSLWKNINTITTNEKSPLDASQEVWK
jgi:hypothetical protein